MKVHHSLFLNLTHSLSSTPFRFHKASSEGPTQSPFPLSSELVLIDCTHPIIYLTLIIKKVKEMANQLTSDTLGDSQHSCSPFFGSRPCYHGNRVGM